MVNKFFLKIFLDEEAVILICGSRHMIKDHVMPLLNITGFKNENIIVFD